LFEIKPINQALINQSQINKLTNIPYIKMSNQPNEQARAFVQAVLDDYKTCCVSRETSLLGRKEVLTGKAKFGIFGDGKEVPQVAMARAFKAGDFRAGYYRDQTFMFAAGLATVEDFFAQLYADTENDPFSAGRQMNGHYATDLVDENGNWRELKNLKNVSSDISPTAGQMARALGLAMASKYYRENPDLQNTAFSKDGEEVCFVTIGDASTSEGVFWETMNAAAVTQVPLAINVWDDGYGISVPIEFQTTKGSISAALAGFKKEQHGSGMEIHVLEAWNYPQLVATYEAAIAQMRRTHTPVLFHVRECTQPQGHSTSGSHERYKSKERLAWEKEFDCIEKMREWIISVNLATAETLDAIRTEAKQHVREAQQRAAARVVQPIKAEMQIVYDLLDAVIQESRHGLEIQTIKDDLQREMGLEPLRRYLIVAAKTVLRRLQGETIESRAALITWLNSALELGKKRYTTHLHSESQNSVANVEPIAPIFTENSLSRNGYEVINAYFDAILEKHKNVIAFGEDVGQIGDVNQGFMGLQEKHGKHRVFDTGIREWTIMGQGLGMAMRGLRPIAEIQYLDYLLYGLIPLSDDLATLQYRTAGKQRAPLIIRSRGHRLEGIWHTGSPIGMILSTLRGINVCVPRSLVQAAQMYNTLLASDEPGLVIECLNGYRLKETQPDNITEARLELGVPEILAEGTDVTLVTYGSCVRVAQDAIKMLATHGISVELIDAQTLLPFDKYHSIVQSVSKTNRLIVLDEDVPGGASAYILQQILENQNAYQYLDSAPKTITAFAGRSPYGSEGDYFTKPSADDVFETVYTMMREANPQGFVGLW
jgi:pyruvate/2-oxoglutarate/acetoin dehydrogenase E1 component/TPP-dependent pyruvate/acetoin dehydrogenase alpha subunit